MRWLVVLVVACTPAVRPQLQQLPAQSKLYDLQTAAPFVAAERYRGKVVVLDFWAGWCLECKRTVPQIRRLADAFAPAGLVVVGVNAGEGAADVAAYAKDLGIDYPIALDPELELSDRVGAGKLPMLLVLDRDGSIVHRAKTVDAETLGVIRKLLGPRTAR
ncbi:MAG: TlpA disulfide reductase family protein [Kofleriaceae bacterium]